MSKKSSIANETNEGIWKSNLNVHFLLQVCKGPDVGEVVVRSIRGQSVEVIADNKELKESLSKRALPQVMGVRY
jgi:hypothetical protein